MNFLYPIIHSPSLRPLLRTLVMTTLTTVMMGCTRDAPEAQTILTPSTPRNLTPSKVVLTEQRGKWQLTRDGQPYFIRGAGGDVHLDKVVAAGGNSIRTWGTSQLGNILDRAHEKGLTVTAGLWLAHERHGFSYEDEQAVVKQRQTALAAVEQYKNHPALLMWGIGNEMEAKGENPRIWREINEIAQRIKEIDLHHPTMTVLAGVSAVKLQNMQTLCPSIDILGVNTYGGLRVLPQRLLDFGWKKPYVVTEFGPPGPWESGKTAWGAPIELTSTQKAAIYERNYREAIEAQRSWCLGSYAFKWGHKQEATATWFGMLLPDGETLGAVDEMASVWTGKVPNHRAPQIKDLRLESATGTTLGAEPVITDSALIATIDAESPNNYPMTIRWDLREESLDRKNGGDKEKEPTARPLPPAEGSGRKLVFTAPVQPGAYRLFVYVSDGKGKAATANVPFLVKLAE